MVFAEVNEAVKPGPFTRTHEPNKLTHPYPDGFIAWLVEHCIGIAEVMGSNSVEAG